MSVEIVSWEDKFIEKEDVYGLLSEWNWLEEFVRSGKAKLYSIILALERGESKIARKFLKELNWIYGDSYLMNVEKVLQERYVVLQRLVNALAVDPSDERIRERFLEVAEEYYEIVKSVYDELV